MQTEVLPTIETYSKEHTNNFAFTDPDLTTFVCSGLSNKA